MWYVIQINTGHEDKIAVLFKTLLPPESYTECFIPKYERLIKKEKEWTRVRQILFPGYVFLITDDIFSVKPYFKQIPELTKVLGDGAIPIPISKQEEEFLMTFGKEEHVVELSTGIKKDDKVIITDGPMKDFKGKIKKIDRHKRIAIIEVEMFGRTTEIKVGLEIVNSAE